MYRLHTLATLLLLLASPAQIVTALPIMLQANTAHAAVAQTVPYKLTLDTSSATALAVTKPTEPNFDTDVLTPLRQAQAAKAAQKAAKARVRIVTVANAPATADTWYRLRLCESGNTYTRNSGNGYYGAYQYSLGTWNGYGGFARPDQAPAEVQDAKAQADFAVRGWSPWPACGRMISGS